jgi:hypothetical protein
MVWLLSLCLFGNWCYAGEAELIRRYQTLRKAAANVNADEKQRLINELIDDFEYELNNTRTGHSSSFLISLGQLYQQGGRVLDSIALFDTVAGDNSLSPNNRLRAANLATSAVLMAGEVDIATRVFDRYETLVKEFRERTLSYSSMYDQLYIVLDHKRAKFFEDYGISLARALKAQGKDKEAEACANDYRIQANNFLDRYIDMTLNSQEVQKHLDWLQSMNWDGAASLYKSAHLHGECADYYSRLGLKEEAAFHRERITQKLESFFDKYPANPKFSQFNAVLLLQTKEPFFEDSTEYYEYATQIETRVAGEGIAFLLHLYKVSEKLKGAHDYIVSNKFLLLSKRLFERQYPDKLSTDDLTPIYVPTLIRELSTFSVVYS